MAIKKTPRTARTRAEVKDAFEETKGTVTARDAVPAHEREVQSTRDSAVRAAVKDLSVDSTVQKLTNVGLEVQKSLAGVSEKLIAQVTELNTLQDAVKLEQAELERLHGVDAVLSDLDASIADHDAKVEALENEIALTRVKWDEEKAITAKAISEAEVERVKQQARNEADYNYNLSIKRKKDQDEFNENARLLASANKSKQEVLEKTWAVREEALKAQEVNLARLIKLEADQPEVIRKAEAKAEAIATNSLKREYENKMALAQKDADSAAKLATQNIASLEATIAAQNLAVAKLQVELAKAQEQVKSIAEKALDSASGARALAEVQSLTQQQNNRNGGKQ